MNIDQIRRRRATVETVHDVVHALRAVAAGRIQSAQRVAASADRYYEVVLRSLGAVAVDSVPAQRAARQPGRIGLLVLTSEQPLCGALTQNIVDLAERRSRELNVSRPVLLMAVGRRGIRQLIARGIVVDVAETGATSLAGLHDLVKRIASALAAGYASGELGEVRVLYSRYVSVSEQVPSEERLLPPDLLALQRQAPPRSREFAHYMLAEELIEALLAEYAFIALYRIAAQMFTCEQAARLVAMDGATRSAQRMMQSLTTEENRARQEQITNGVLELIGARSILVSQERSAEP